MCQHLVNLFRVHLFSVSSNWLPEQMFHHMGCIFIFVVKHMTMMVAQYLNKLKIGPSYPLNAKNSHKN